MEKTDGQPLATTGVVGESRQTVFPVKIAKIATPIKDGSAGREQNILFRGMLYRPINDLNVQDLETIIGHQFSCRTFNGTNENNENENALWLVLNSDVKLNFFSDRNYPPTVRRVIRQFFIVARKKLFDENEDIESGVDDDEGRERHAFVSTVEDLYKHLEAAHAADDCSHLYTDGYIQHESLQVKLKPYQFKTIKWMLSREIVPKYHTGGFIEIKRRSIGSVNDSTRFFYNPAICSLTTNPDVIQPVLVPTGGILAEEMGMGKTIEILDLILLNPRPLNGTQLAGPLNTEMAERPVTKADVKCLCVQTKTTDCVRCTKCSKVQHRKCVDQENSEITPDASYLCPACWENEEPLPVKSTFIVSPQSIKMQWKTEIDSRIQSGTLSAFLYVGSRSCKWISPAKLASYDVILTDYETLRSEFDFTGRNVSTRVLRNSSITIKRKSPLMRMNFWRVCLDESQMVNDMRTKHSKIISDLSTVHRWAVTGTPIETSLDDLFGLLSFINYSPYNRIQRWHELVRELDMRSNFEPIVSVLKPIMRRTCKTESIMTEMDVPKQQQVVHSVEISSLNRHHYNQERMECRETFNKLIKAFPIDTRLVTLNPNALEQLMEPVRTLRRICSILHVLDKEGNTIVMRPQQMLQYLINTNISGAKLELATIFSKLKSLTALGTGKHKKRELVAGIASETCKNVLNWSKDHQNEPTMIESLLQIQVAHLMALVKTQNNSSYDIDLKSLEKNFYSSQWDALTNFKADRQKEIDKFRDIGAYVQKNCFEWAHGILTDQKSDLQLYAQIKGRTSTAFENVSHIVSSTTSVLNTLSEWSHNLLIQRTIFKNSFAQLDNLVGTLNSQCDKEKLSSELFATLSKEATNCHLNDSLEDSLDSLANDTDTDDEPPTKRARFSYLSADASTPPNKAKKECTLCSIWKQLEKYGSFISDNAHKMTNKAGRCGENINPSFQEFVLKVILQSNEYLGNINTKVGIDLLTALENFRFEFHTYKNLLISIRKNVDCFYRVQQRKAPKPTVTADDILINRWMDTIEHSKQAYVRAIRTNCYLNCMKENFDVDDCSICMTSIVEYVSFQCGHQCCAECFTQLQRVRIHSRQPEFECPFCRQIQLALTARHFTVDKSEKFTDSSTKIENIVREVHKLKQSDPNVKILLFSQWADILHTLKNELLSNDIASRSIVNTTKSLEQMVEEFKDPQKNITCLLMPYKYGSKGLNLTEATHVFLVEPILNRGEELQTLGRVHRIGQTRETVVHRFITKNTIEETIYKVMSTEAAGVLASENCTIKTLVDLFADTDDSETSTV